MEGLKPSTHNDKLAYVTGKNPIPVVGLTWKLQFQHRVITYI